MATPSAPADAPQLEWTRRLRRTRVAVPTVLQMEAAECGAACLGMVLAHFGRWIPLEDLRTACGVSRDGANGRSILRAARAQGLTAHGHRLTLEQVASESFPVIAHWRFSHFVVVEGVSAKGVYINDPAFGRTVVSWRDADRDFTGVVLRLTPDAEFVRSGSPPAPWRELWSRTAGLRSALVYLVVACAALAIPLALAPAALKGYIDMVLVGGLPEWIPATAGTLLIAGILALWLTWWQGSVARRLALTMSYRQTTELMRHALRLPLDFYMQRFAGDVAFRLQLVDGVSEVAAMQLVPTAVSLATAAAVGVIIFVYAWQLGLVALIAACLVALIMRTSARWRLSAAARASRELADFSGTLAYGLSSIETVKASGTESDLFVASNGRHVRAVNAVTRLQLSATALAALPPLVAGVTMAVTLAAGGLLVVSGQMSAGGFVAVLALMPLFLGPIGAWAALGTTIQQSRAALERLDDLLGHSPDPLAEDDTGESVSASRVALPSTPVLELRNVTYAYNPLATEPTVSGVSLVVEPGRFVGLVGPSGCGKSTVARLAVGLLPPSAGDVFLGDRPLREWPRDDRVGTLAYVDQDIVLFSGSVRDNITLFDRAMPDSEVTAAATAAAIHDDIIMRAGGYEATVAEGGANFSGGQRQRLEVARALAGAPGLLVLDEALSALDPTTESKVVGAVRDTGAGVLIIAHRLASVRDCDEILVMDRGAVVERGRHDELLAAGGAYARMAVM